MIAVQHSKPADSSDYDLDPDHPHRQEAVRFLDRDLVTPGALRQEVDRNADRSINGARLVVDRDVSSESTFVKARIRGIDRKEVIAHWLQIEHKLARGPRESIVDLLEERAERLDDIGDRDDRATGDRTPALEKTVRWDTDDGSRPTMAGVGNRHPSLATDGGER